MSTKLIHICDGCGAEERDFGTATRTWSKAAGEDLCAACTGEFAAWKAQRAAEPTGDWCRMCDKVHPDIETGCRGEGRDA